VVQSVFAAGWKTGVHKEEMDLLQTCIDALGWMRWMRKFGITPLPPTPEATNLGPQASARTLTPPYADPATEEPLRAATAPIGVPVPADEAMAGEDTPPHPSNLAIQDPDRDGPVPMDVDLPVESEQPAAAQPLENGEAGGGRSGGEVAEAMKIDSGAALQRSEGGMGKWAAVAPSSVSGGKRGVLEGRLKWGGDSPVPADSQGGVEAGNSQHPCTSIGMSTFYIPQLCPC
jgi:hypothetical protein